VTEETEIHTHQKVGTKKFALLFGIVKILVRLAKEKRRPKEKTQVAMKGGGEHGKKAT